MNANYLFIDRDGTLIVEPPDQQIDSHEKFRLVDGVVPALRDLKKSGFYFVMVTNQDGLGSTTNPQKNFDEIQTLLLGILESQGIKFEEILICPHRADESCACRKPKTALVQKYLRSNDMNRDRSFVIGDRATDLELAQNMGLKGYLLNEKQNWSNIAHDIIDRPRRARIHRKTNETEIDLSVDLDGDGTCDIQTEQGFFNHMLEQIARHGKFDLKVAARGDFEVDDHHLVEDVGIVLGSALLEALGDKRGIGRYGFYLPMDETTSQVTLDLSGRFHFSMQAKFPRESVGGLATEMVPHFFRSLAESGKMALHIETLGENTHHMVEATFKAVGRSLRQALARNGDQQIPSSKGVL